MKGRPKHSFLRDNGLSLAVLVLFVLCLIGHALSGWHVHNQEEKEHFQPSVPLTEYLSSGDFGESVFENWESEFLQMGLYVLMTACLFQRGSAESKDPDASEAGGSKGSLKKTPTPVKKGGWALKIYRHSLSLGLLALFAFSFVGHALCGVSKFNADAREHGERAHTLLGYVSSAQFWFESFQNWQSEFLSIGVLVILSIWLREKGSPQSKEVGAPHSQTGT